MTVPVLKEIWTRQKEQLKQQIIFDMKKKLKDCFLVVIENPSLLLDLPQSEDKKYVLRVFDSMSYNILNFWHAEKREDLFPAKEFEITCIKNEFDSLMLGLRIKPTYDLFKSVGLIG